jgi:hypothetical protein
VTALEPLLRRWAALEPARCISPERTSAPETGEHLVVIDGAMYGVFNTLVQQHDPESRSEAGIVQVAAQEAVIARGWGYTITSGLIRKEIGAVALVSFFGRSKVTKDERFYSYSDEDQSPGVALLSAYLQALAAAEAAKEGS